MGNTVRDWRDPGAIDEEERQYATGGQTLEEFDEKSALPRPFLDTTMAYLFSDTQIGPRTMARRSSSQTYTKVYSIR